MSTETLKLPTDHQLSSLVYSMWHKGLNRELSNIVGCMASRMNVETTPEFTAAIKKQLDRLVREKEIRRQRFLPGRPFYTIA